VGGGIDWMIARNIALEAEIKYLSLSPDVVVEGRLQDPPSRQAGALDALLVALGLRVFFP
jgi:outer membrane protein W